ncbi:MAG TPA: hypothetical protein VJQ57_08315, partial [Acidimicrobiia bacterium]|nr:hypothetical protein [Acidimicrobiia bacterium]
LDRGEIVEVKGVPDPHRLVHATTAKQGSDRTLALVPEGMGVVGGLGPIQAAVLVGDVAVE